MLRVLNISHADLDGVASAIAIRTAHPEDHVKTEFVFTGGVNGALKRGLESRIPWDVIILSDVSIKIPVAGTVWKDEREKELVHLLPELIREFVQDGGRFIVIDHHETALPMKVFYNSELDPESILQVKDEEGNPVAGSELAAIYMMRKLGEIEDSIISAEIVAVENGDDVEFKVLEYDLDTYALLVNEFCRIAGDLDVWRDPFGFGGKLGLAMSLMDDTYGSMEDFLALITAALSMDVDFEQAIEEVPVLNYYYNMASNKLSGALNLAERSCVEHANHFHQIEAKFFPDHCAERIYNKTNGVVLVTYPGSGRRVSFRKAQDFPVNLGAFCKRFGGGGHENSAGMDIPQDMTLDDVIDEMLMEINKKR